MKRESINSSEAQMGQDSLRPLIDDMLHERKNAYDKINKMFGLNTSCEFMGAEEEEKENEEGADINE